MRCWIGLLLIETLYNAKGPIDHFIFFDPVCSLWSTSSLHVVKRKGDEIYPGDRAEK